VINSVDSNTRVLIGHSLGSVVCYEALFEIKSNVGLFLTIGSPLGMPSVVFEKLLPAPQNGIGLWPSGANRWTNVADPHDFVALVKSLSSKFARGPSEGIRDILISNEELSHDGTAYLTAEETGSAIASVLNESA
jgi:pimeloyl-ACP methyl ester carboxylesterase